MPKSGKRVLQRTGGKSAIVECPHCRQRVIPSSSGFCPSCNTPMSATLPENIPQPSIASVEAYTPKQIFLLSVFTGYPTGLVLSSINWSRMGMTGTAVVHWIAGVILLTIWSAIPNDASCGTWAGIILQVGFSYYLFLQMKQSIGKIKRDGNEIVDASWKSGCFTTFITLSVLIILSALFVLLLTYSK